MRSHLPGGGDVLAFQCRNPIHKAHYELFTRALDADNVSKDAVCLVHPTCGPTQDDDIPGIVRYQCAAAAAAAACKLSPLLAAPTTLCRHLEAI